MWGGGGPRRLGRLHACPPTPCVPAAVGGIRPSAPSVSSSTHEPTWALPHYSLLHSFDARRLPRVRRPWLSGFLLCRHHQRHVLCQGPECRQRQRAPARVSARARARIGGRARGTLHRRRWLPCRRTCITPISPPGPTKGLCTVADAPPRLTPNAVSLTPNAVLACCSTSAFPRPGTGLALYVSL